MRIIQNEFTNGVCAITSMKDSEILVGTESGMISLWRPQNFQHIRNYAGDKKKIRLLAPTFERSFISVNENAVIRVWDTDSGICKMVLTNGTVCMSVGAVVILPNNLLVISGHCSDAWEAFDVWDLETGVCIFKSQQLCHRPNGMQLGITAEGYLVACECCNGVLKVWQVDRTECKLKSECKIDRIYSMTTLPTGEIVTGNHDLDFYKISFDTGIHKYKSLYNSNVIDTIYPIAGYKVLVVDRSSFCANTIKLWNYISESYERLGNSIIVTSPMEVSYCHIVLEKEGAILSLSTNKIVIHEFTETIFHFPPKLAEIRKNACILAQAYRKGTSSFANLPKEILLKVAVMTSEDLNECEREVCEKIARNYFSKPSVC